MLKDQCPVKWKHQFPEGTISLGMADVDFEGPSGINEYISQHLNDAYSFYQHQNGMPFAITAIQSYLKRLNVNAEEKNIQLIPGTMLGIYASQKWASRRNGKIVYAGPLYEPIHRHGRDNGNEQEFIEITNDGLHMEQLQESVNKYTKMIAINNPCNPIGYVYNKNELKTIRDLAVDYDIICLSDELYAPLVFERSKNKFISLASIDGMAERTIALYGFSKAYGLAGYRSGFMYLGDKIQEEVHHIIESQLVSPSPITSIVAKYALTDSRAKQWVEDFTITVEKRTQFARDIMVDAGYNCNLPDSCFFIYPNIGTDDVKLSEEMIGKGLWVVPGSIFGPTGKEHLRINCATSEERLQEGLSRLIKHLQQ